VVERDLLDEEAPETGRVLAPGGVVELGGALGVLAVAARLQRVLDVLGVLRPLGGAELLHEAVADREVEQAVLEQLAVAQVVAGAGRRPLRRSQARENGGGTGTARPVPEDGFNGRNRRALAEDAV